MTYYSPPGIIREVRPFTFDDIEVTVCAFYGEPLERVYSRTRKLTPRWCRHLICFFAVELMGASTPAIGRRIGRHYSTVIKCRMDVINRKNYEQLFAAEVNEIRRRIQERRAADT